METAICFRSTVKAREFEKYLKSGSGREFARRQFLADEQFAGFWLLGAFAMGAVTSEGCA